MDQRFIIIRQWMANFKQKIHCLKKHVNDLYFRKNKN